VRFVNCSTGIVLGSEDCYEVEDVWGVALKGLCVSE